MSKKQHLISSFFGGQPAVVTTQSTRQPKSTPERVSLARATSLLARMNAPDEFASLEPDTSLGSPEIKNFRTPSLNTLGTRERDEMKENIPLSPIKRNAPPAKRTASAAEILLSFTQKRLKRTATPPVLHQEAKAGIELSDEQKQVLHYVSLGENIFFTGSAGTGKSVVLRHLVKVLQARHGALKVGVTALTGMAACNIEGQTVHKFLGIGLGVNSAQELALKIKRNRALKYKWKNLRVLIIDEISMIDGKLFTKLCELARIVRESPRPFGGIQLICTGDFFQLPPVSKDNTGQYCFQSPMWSKTINRTVVLQQVFRQKSNELVDMLNALRYGNLDDAMVQKFRALSRRVNYTDGIEPTELYPTRAEVKLANLLRLRNLPGQSRFFKAIDNVSDPQYKRLYDNMMCEEVLELKENCQVMYLKNLDDNIVNGSVGTVMFFMTTRLWGEVTNQYRSLLIDALPETIEELKILANCTGGSLSDEAKTRIDYLVPPERRSTFHKLVHVARQELPKDMEPVVNFKATDGSYSLHKVGYEEFFSDVGNIRLGSGATVDRLERRQLPLLLAWAMSIHKAQGQSIERLRINLQKTFEKGQVYVALSRATNKDSLELYNFDPRRISTSQEVKEFYTKLAKKQSQVV